MSSSRLRPKRHRPLVMGYHGMVASAHPLASLAGVDVLQRGGNAVDAAIAVNAVLNVTQPGACGIGGDLFALIYWAKEGRVRFLNGSGRTPAATDVALLQSGAAMPQRGIRSVSVPGCVDAWFTMHEAYGSLPVAELLAPAIRLADQGFPISDKMAAAIAATLKLDPHPSWTATYAPQGRAPKAGSRFVQRDLARSLTLIAEGGRDAFYKGPIARAIVDLSNSLGGWFTLEDLALHSSEWGEPIQTEYRGYTIFETPPNTQGLAALIGLNIMEGFAMGGEWLDAKRLHLQIEAKKLAFAERDRHVADPAFYQAPLERLLSKSYASELRSRIDPEHAVDPEEVQPHPGGTTYFAIVDGHGNIVSCVQSLFQGFGALVVPEGTGISLHNRGSYFSLDPSHPNVIAPGKRPFHTLIASMVFKGDRPVLAFGTMGGDGQPQTHMQVFSNLFDHGMDLQEAIEAPRWLHGDVGPQRAGARLYLESRFGEKVAHDLRQMGHDVVVVGPWEDVMGHAQGVWIDGDLLIGAADPRGDGYALGW
jgi:gamma-glutamyltranspeptidase